MDVYAFTIWLGKSRKQVDDLGISFSAKQDLHCALPRDILVSRVLVALECKGR